VHRKDLEIVARHTSHGYSLGLRSPGDRLHAVAIFRHCLKRAVLRANISKVCVGERKLVALGIHLPQAHDLLRLVIGQRPQQYAVNHTEDGRSSADSQRKSENGNKGKDRIAAKHARAVTYIANEPI